MLARHDLEVAAQGKGYLKRLKYRPDGIDSKSEPGVELVNSQDEDSDPDGEWLGMSASYQYIVSTMSDGTQLVQPGKSYRGAWVELWPLVLQETNVSTFIFSYFWHFKR